VRDQPPLEKQPIVVVGCIYGFRSSRSSRLPLESVRPEREPDGGFVPSEPAHDYSDGPTSFRHRSCAAVSRIARSSASILRSAR
jgi:hypothetical protein